MLIIILLLTPAISACVLWMLAGYMRRLEKIQKSMPAYVRFAALFFAAISVVSIALLAITLWVVTLVKLYNL